MMNCIEIKGITKDFKNTRALNNVNLTFEENKIYGLLGRNGAGKSTLLKIISNRIFTDSGSVTVDGINSMEDDRALSKIYIMSESNLYPPKMKIRIFLNGLRNFILPLTLIMQISFLRLSISMLIRIHGRFQRVIIQFLK